MSALHAVNYVLRTVGVYVYGGVTEIARSTHESG